MKDMSNRPVDLCAKLVATEAERDFWKMQFDEILNNYRELGQKLDARKPFVFDPKAFPASANLTGKMIRYIPTDQKGEGDGALR